jgi:hypothetical protein
LLITTLDEDSEGWLSVAAKRIGAPVPFGRIWQRLGVSEVLGGPLTRRVFEFAVEHGGYAAPQLLCGAAKGLSTTESSPSQRYVLWQHTRTNTHTAIDLASDRF